MEISSKGYIEYRVSNIQQHHQTNNRRISRLLHSVSTKMKHNLSLEIRRDDFIANDETNDQSFKKDIKDTPTIPQHQEPVTKRYQEVYL